MNDDKAHEKLIERLKLAQKLDGFISDLNLPGNKDMDILAVYIACKLRIGDIDNNIVDHLPKLIKQIDLVLHSYEIF